MITANNFKTKTQNHHCSQVLVTCWAGTSPQEVKSAAEIERYSKMDKGKGGRRGRGIEAQQKGARARHFQECTNGPSFSLIQSCITGPTRQPPKSIWLLRNIPVASISICCTCIRQSSGGADDKSYVERDATPSTGLPHSPSFLRLHLASWSERIGLASIIDWRAPASLDSTYLS